MQLRSKRIINPVEAPKTPSKVTNLTRQETYNGLKNTIKDDFRNFLFEVPLHEMIEAEAFLFGLKALILSEVNQNLAKKVAILPCFNESVLRGALIDVMDDKIRKHPKYRRWLPETWVLPERKALAARPDLLQARDEEERKRNAQNRRLKEEATNLLNASDAFETLFEDYLQVASATNKTLGDIQTPSRRFRNCNQWVIPLLRNSHFTIVVAQRVSEDEIHIQYYNSFGGDLDPSLKEGLIQFFRKHASNITYQCESRYDQYDGINCGIYSTLFALDALREYEGLAPYYFQHYRYNLTGARLLITNHMERHGCIEPSQPFQFTFLLNKTLSLVTEFIFSLLSKLFELKDALLSSKYLPEHFHRSVTTKPMYAIPVHAATALPLPKVKIEPREPSSKKRSRTKRQKHPTPMTPHYWLRSQDVPRYNLRSQSRHTKTATSFKKR